MGLTGFGDFRKARLEADRFLQSALSTAEPNLQALAWEVAARVAMAEKDWEAAEQKIEQGLAFLAAAQVQRIQRVGDGNKGGRHRRLPR